MVTEYSHQLEATDASVVSHEGLADLVSGAASVSPPALPPSAHHSFSTASFDYAPPSSSPYSSPYPLSQPDFDYPSASSIRSPTLPRTGTLNSLHDRRDAPNERGWTTEVESNPFKGFQRGVGYERDLHPWSSHSAATGHSLDPYDSGRKGRERESHERRLGQRIKRLEREFGRPTTPASNSTEQSQRQRLKDGMRAMKEEKEMEKRLERERSGVDDKGRLVVEGRRKRIVVRWIQGLGAVTVGIASIGASLLTHPEEKPPTAGSIALVALYILPFVSLSITVYLFVLRPCLDSRQRSRTAPLEPGRGRGRGVYPLSYPAENRSQNWCDCFRRPHRVPRGGTRSQLQFEQPPSINLVLDPSWFGQQPLPPPVVGSQTDRERTRRRKQRRHTRRRHRRRRRTAERKRRKDEEARIRRGSRERDPDFEDETDLVSHVSSPSDSDDTSEYYSSGESTTEPDDDELPNNPRSFSSILAHVHLEERWLVARKRVKFILVVDVVLGLGWGAVGVSAIALGEKCPVGGFQGFCDLYNLAVAGSIMLSTTFFVAVAFDGLDLKRTDVSPRHRQQRLATTKTKTTKTTARDYAVAPV